MLCPVDIKIKTSSHRERLVVREVWEQSRRRRGDLPSQRFRSQSKNDLQQEREREKTENTDAALPVYFTTPNGERGMGGMGRGGDEEDIKEKKRIRTFYGILSLSTLSLSVSRSLLLLHYRSHHWNSGDSTWRFLSARHRQVGRFSLSHGGTWCTGMR